MYLLNLLMGWLLLAGPQLHPSETPTLIGKWAVVKYAEQGVPVDKTANPSAEAQKVYALIKEEKADRIFGWMEPGNRRMQNVFLAWQVADSIAEVARLERIIPLPYYVVFFPDSTMSTYNYDPATGKTENIGSWPYVYHESFQSFDYQTNSYTKSNAQILAFTQDHLTLFLPNTAEVVELVKVSYQFP